MFWRIRMMLIKFTISILVSCPKLTAWYEIIPFKQRIEVVMRVGNINKNIPVETLGFLYNFTWIINFVKTLLKQIFFDWACGPRRPFFSEYLSSQGKPLRIILFNIPLNLPGVRCSAPIAGNVLPSQNCLILSSKLGRFAPECFNE